MKTLNKTEMAVKALINNINTITKKVVEGSLDPVDGHMELQTIATKIASAHNIERKHLHSIEGAIFKSLEVVKHLERIALYR